MLERSSESVRVVSRLLLLGVLVSKLILSILACQIA
jgi:hypothetical protein